MTEEYSFKGWNFKEWLRGNKESVKFTLSALFAYAAWGANMLPEGELKLLTVGLVGALTKLLLDSFDYWLKEK